MFEIDGQCTEEGLVGCAVLLWKQGGAGGRSAFIV